MQKLKAQIYQHCVSLIQEKIEAFQAALKTAQDGANNETKSSAGDKHETARAMAHLETEKLIPQLTEAKKLRDILSKINMENKADAVGSGSLVSTNKGLFYIAIGLGKLLLGDKVVFVISPAAPIGKLLLHKKAGEKVNFNGMDYCIEKID